MPMIDDNSLDECLKDISTNVTKLHVTHTEATTYSNVATYTLGNEPSPSLGAPANGDASGRKITVSAVTSGVITSTGTAAYWALVDTGDARLKAAGSLSGSQALVSTDNTFSLTAFDIELPDPS